MARRGVLPTAKRETTLESPNSVGGKRRMSATSHPMKAGRIQVLVQAALNCALTADPWLACCL